MSSRDRALRAVGDKLRALAEEVTTIGQGVDPATGKPFGADADAPAAAEDDAPKGDATAKHAKVPGPKPNDAGQDPPPPPPKP